MLVFTRSVNEQIIINDNIVVTVVDVRGDKARLGIEAPRQVAVHRGEVYEAIRRSRAEPGGVARTELPGLDRPAS